MHRIVTSCLAVTLLTGCATITKGTTQTVAIDTPGAPGASCTLSSAGIGNRVVVTPATVSLDKSQHAISVRCSKECFQDGIGLIASNTETMTAGNILVGGVIGLGVDAASGAMNKYTEQSQIAMVAVPDCRPSSLVPPMHGRRQPGT